MKKFICIFAVLTMLFSAISLCVSAEGYDISEPTDGEIAAKQAEIDQIRDVIPGEVVVSFNDEVPFESRRGLLEAVAAFLYPSASREELEKTVDCREGYSIALLKVKPEDGARAAAILEKSHLVSGVEFNFTAYIDDPAGIKGDVDGDDRIGANDYAMVKRSVLGTYTLEGEAALRADVNGDGAVDALDYAVLKRHVLGTYDIALIGD